VNSTRVILAVLTLISAPAFSACSSSEEKALVQAKRPVGAGSTKTANAELEEAVKATFNSDAQLKAANLKVDADVTRNEVTLSGTVSSEALRKKAVDLAKSAQVGVIVTDKISVRPNASRAAPPRTALV
jgi:osmotically-inducible protein OsmY